MRNFKELLVWQKGIDIAVQVYQLTSHLPEREKYGLISQLNRAAVSVPSNIAEGCGRGSDPAFIQFLEYAIGSVFEIETQCILIDRMQLAPKEHIDKTLSMIDEEGKMLNGLISSLR